MTRPYPWRFLRAAVIIIGALLAPVFFLDMFITVVHLVRPSFGEWAWTVPAATEGSFVVLYLLDLLLQWAGKPMGWLRFAPYPFAAASLLLNVYASRGDLPGMLGHAVVTTAFFLPLIAGESAVRSLSVTDEAIALAAEHAAARRYAMDLVRDQKGIFWRLRIPSLLRTRIVRGRFPAAVADAVRDGASYGGAAKWEAAVEQMVTDALTQGVRMTATVKRQERQIERQAQVSDEPQNDGQKPRQNGSRKTVSDTARKRARAARLLTAQPALSVAEVAAKAGVSESTVGRVKKELGERHGLAAVR